MAEIGGQQNDRLVEMLTCQCNISQRSKYISFVTPCLHPLICDLINTQHRWWDWDLVIGYEVFWSHISCQHCDPHKINVPSCQ